MRFVFLSIIFFSSLSSALYTELGFNYSYKKSYIDSINNLEQQGLTGSVSFYFLERVALELSYTNALMVKKEQNLAAVTTSRRTTTQISDLYGLDFIYVFADKKAPLQPYIKGGVTYISKIQRTQIDNDPVTSAGPYNGNAPGWGVGLKYFISESVAVRTSYDVIITPIDNNASAEDVNGRVGLSWIF